MPFASTARETCKFFSANGLREIACRLNGRFEAYWTPGDAEDVSALNHACTFSVVTGTGTAGYRRLILRSARRTTT